MSERKKGKFIVFEGVGGCGKGTQIEMLKDCLVYQGKSVLVTCEHTRDTPPGKLIHKIIYGQEENIDPIALQLMYVSDRANHTARVILPALEENDFVLGDRYEASTITYAPPEMRNYFLAVNRGITIKPDLTVIIDLEPDEALKRVYSRNDADMFDKREKFIQVRAGLRWYFDNSGWPCAWVDGSKSREGVLLSVIQEIQRRGICDFDERAVKALTNEN